MRKIIGIALVCCGIFLSLDVSAESAAEQAQLAADLLKAGKIEEGALALDEALSLARQSLPLHFRKALFVKAPAEGYGIYQARESAVFSAKAPLFIYAEPAGFDWMPRGELYRASLTFDAELQDEAEKTLNKVTGVQSIEVESRERNREFMLNLNLTLNDAPPGKYIWKITARDAVGQGEASFNLPFEIKD